MTTSGVTTWSLTARDIVRAAMQELAVLAGGEEPSASELSDATLRLNGMLKSWAVKGGNLFRETQATVTIPANTASVALPAGIRSVSSARVVVSATQERPLGVFNRSQYLILPNKAAVGQPSIFYVADGGDIATLHIWPVPTATTTVILDHARVAETVTDASQTLDIPSEWQEAAYTNLAIRIAPMFGATPSQELYTRAQMLEAQLLDSDRPDSYYFEAEPW